MNTLTIGSSGGTARLEITSGGRHELQALLSEAGISASAEVAQIGGGDFLDTYLASLSDNWRGWSGAKEWQSLEGALTLSATIDPRGHVALVVTLQNGAPWHWQAAVVFDIEAGQLQKLASDALVFCKNLGVPA